MLDTSNFIDQDSYFFGNDLSPFLKWPGGKTSELSKISRASSSLRPTRFIDPFVGGGSVLLNVRDHVPALVNDLCPELIRIYKSGAEKDFIFRGELEALSGFWNSLSNFDAEWSGLAEKLVSNQSDIAWFATRALSVLKTELNSLDPILRDEFYIRLSKDMPKKILRIQKIQKSRMRNLPEEEMIANLEGSIRSAFYMSIRHRYNLARSRSLFSKTRDADFFFLREYCYASMFRFNSRGEFNIPYGGVTYNRKQFDIKIERLFSEDMSRRLRGTSFYNMDFQDFFDQITVGPGDFIFVDPPYDSDFTKYDDRDFFSSDQSRLASILSSMSANIMIVIGDTPLIRKLYPESIWRIQSFPVEYKWTIKDRNERKTQHLTITNF